MRALLKLLLLLTIALPVLVVVAWIAWPEPKPEPPVDFDNYVPSPQFAAAHKALTSGTNAAPVGTASAPASSPSVAAPTPAPASGAYDLEKTMEVFRSIELAQKGQTDWMAFLKVLAEQDYDGVPGEVMQAQAMILPIMERLNEVEAQLGEVSDSMAVLNSLNAGAVAVVENMDAKTLAAMAIAGPFGVLKGGDILSQGLQRALDAHKQGRIDRRKYERQLREIQLAYFKFLAKCVPIRRKYAREWDELCLQKDRAYLQVGQGRHEDALATTADIIRRYPADREATLLRALSLTRLAILSRGKAAGTPGDAAHPDLPTPRRPGVRVAPDDPLVVEAAGLLERYLAVHPDASGPALVLKGLVACATGDVARARVSFDQSAIEYPRQAGKLNGMLEAYASRPHLEKTAEGQGLLWLHRSLCEGFGAFSPNLEKAFAYENEGDYDKAKEEIYRHFFRRGNQAACHELFSDMEFCEANLTVGFKGLLLEHAFLDLAVDNGGWTDASRELKVSLANRTDFELKNVRVFLCAQFTEMYVGQYDVMKVGTLGKLPPHASHTFPNLAIARDGKTFKDLSRARAIVMTDDRICWVDPVSEKRKHATEVSTGMVKVNLPYTPEEYLAAFGTNAGKLGRMAKEMPVARSKRMVVLDEIELSLPRAFAMLEPVFTVGEIGSEDCVYPSSANVAGGNIVLHFPVRLADGGQVPFCIYSDYASFKVSIVRKGEAVSVAGVEAIRPQRRP